MTHSSQAGLASIQATPVGGDPSFGQRITVNIPVTEPRLIIRTDSGVAFELLRTAVSQGRQWAIIGSIGRQSLTAEAIVGMSFTPGENPMLFARGYCQIVQRELNRHFDNLITEVPR